MFTLLFVVCLLLAQPVLAGLTYQTPHDGNLWGRGWIWLGDDGMTMCISGSCRSLYWQPERATAPTVTPAAAQTPVAASATLGEVPLKGQTKYVSCELRTTANNVEWYYTYRMDADPAQQLPAGFTDWEAFFIARTGQNCNPNRGFRGDINGKFVTTCDPAAGGYGVYPRAIEAGLTEVGIPFRTVYLDVSEENAVQLKELFISSYENSQVLSLWVRQIVDAPVAWETDAETGERYPIATHEHAVSGQVIRAADGSYTMRVIDPWPMYTGLKYDMSFDAILEWMSNLGIYMLQVIG
ncbi:MAG: hypothetical protein LLG44_13320 [Chloroflexi bacterium]|nr:hypothetical protein [Chloroflexota bacterium]